MDRFDSYTSKLLAGDMHAAALREAASDRLARQAARGRVAEGTETASPGLAARSPLRILVAAIRLPRAAG